MTARPRTTESPGRSVAERGTQQTSRGKTLRRRRDHVANPPSGPTRTGHRCRGPVHPPEERLMALHSRSQPQRIYGFLQTRPHGSPPAQPAVGEPPGELRAAPLPSRRWVPPVRAPGQDFHLRSHTICPAHPPSLRARLRDAHALSPTHHGNDVLAAIRHGDRSTISWLSAGRPQRLENHQLIPELPPDAPGEGSLHAG